MADRDKSSNRIPARQSLEYSRWSLPSFGGDASEDERARALASVETDEVEYDGEQGAAGISAEELERITQEAYQEGYQLGYREGYAKGEGEGVHEGREKGFSEGLQEGEQAGLAAGQARIDTQCQQLAQQIEQLQLPLQNQLNQLEEQLLAMAAELAQAVVGRAMTEYAEPLRGVVQQCLTQLPAGAKTQRVLLNPDSFALLDSAGALDPRWQVEVSDQLAPGDVRVEAEHSLVASSVQERMRQALAHWREQQQAVQQLRQQSAEPVLSEPDIESSAESSDDE